MNIEICLFFIVSTWVLDAGSILIGQQSAMPLVCYLTDTKTLTLTLIWTVDVEIVSGVIDGLWLGERLPTNTTFIWWVCVDSLGF